MSDLILVTRIGRPAPGTKLFGPDNRLLADYELAGIARLYWPESEVDRVLKVTRCESGGWTGAWAWEGEDSRGLLQLNVEAHAWMGQYNLFDPQINYYFAFQLWSAQGWGPWTCAHRLGFV